MMIEEELPKIIYHYTTQDSLINIFKTKELWATNIYFMNDASEFNEPLKIVRRILESKLRKDNMKITKLERKLTESLLVDTDIWAVSDNICVVSFCLNGDLLSQWRGYGTPDSAYSIGFNREKLMDTLKPVPFNLYRCEYLNKAKYKERIRKFITEVINDSKQKRELPNAGELIDKFTTMAATMKLDHFQEENEWRLVSTMLSDYEFEFRVGKSMIIPYHPIHFDMSCISEVVIGPSKYQKLALNAVNLLINKFADETHPCIRIRESSIPYNTF
jgi:hypothetical protein